LRLANYDVVTNTISQEEQTMATTIISTKDSFRVTQQLLEEHWVISDATSFNGSYSLELCSPMGQRVDVFLSDEEFYALDLSPIWK
jgi:SHS2 domain-containing protein